MKARRAAITQLIAAAVLWQGVSDGVTYRIIDDGAADLVIEQRHENTDAMGAMTLYWETLYDFEEPGYKTVSLKLFSRAIRDFAKEKKTK